MAANDPKVLVRSKCRTFRFLPYLDVIAARGNHTLQKRCLYLLQHGTIFFSIFIYRVCRAKVKAKAGEMNAKEISEVFTDFFKIYYINFMLP